MSRDTFTLTLTEKRMVTPTVLHMAFSRLNNEPLEFIPGQFITVHFTLDEQTYQRSYSIASIPTEDTTIGIAVSPYENGPGTRFLFGMNIGDQVETSGPFGRLVLKDETPSRYMMIATGTGVTPYRAMLPTFVERIQKQSAKVFVMLGVKSPEELLYQEDFLRYAASSPHLEFHAFYSRVMPDSPQPYEHQGYVQTGFEAFHFNPETDVVYLCGNPNMIDQSFETLVQMGFQTSQVRREKYISPKK
ncbi:MAG: FAD-binding oxidoreductase [Gammaproteobacteria bacterium]